MDLFEVRQDIDLIDNQIKDLFLKRLEIVKKVGIIKAEQNLPILNQQRERDIITRVTDGENDEIASYLKVLYNTIFDVSRSYQNQHYTKSELAEKILEKAKNTSQLFPKSATVACQGIEGANSQFACEKLFSRPNIIYFSNFESIFSAVEKGLCRYGILPIENSLHGSVTAVYDLMKKYKFSIVRSVKLKINHLLLAKKGVKLANIKEIYSHEQAIGQCSEFLKLQNIKVIPCENTAVAARLVSELNRDDVAAISSKSCAELYSLSVVREDIQNNENNYTRFICISKELEIYPGANRISLMLSIPHKAGSLYGIISKFSALGVNLTKLESRPIPNKDFEFMFYIDLEASILSQEILNLICELSDYAVFLGNYSEL